LKVIEVQPEGKNKMGAGDFIRGQRICKGDKFGK